MNDLRNSIKATLASEWSVSPDAIPDNAALNAYEKWDSLGHISIMLALSRQFGFDLTPDVVQSLLSIQAIAVFLAQRTSPSLTEPLHAAASL